MSSARSGLQVLEQRVVYFEMPPTPAAHAAPARTAEISVLTYNVKGLPWPAAKGRGTALREIGAELARLRTQGGQPDVILIQEGFRDEITDLVKASGYRYWVRGPRRSDRPGRWFSGGLHVLSDAPILDVRSATYSHCAGLDCLASKGVMLVRLSLPDGPGEIAIVNTHLNARTASLAAPALSLAAHNSQTDQLTAFLEANHDPATPLLMGGDFNVKGAPQRYYYNAMARPYTVVSEFCALQVSGCEGAAADAMAEPWLKSQDLQAFASNGAVKVRPVKVETLFTASHAKRPLSDHDGYLVRYKLTWSAPAVTLATTRAPGAETPRFGAWGVKVAWKR